MSLPDIRFQNIRPHENSRHAGFEELCCQLAALEALPAGATFFRKGRGGDAGVECFTRYVDGRERGWQAKYVEPWSDALKTQLDKSIRTALNKHPKLTEYVVCLPFDLPDVRSGRGLTPLKHWCNWKATWIATAKDEGRELRIELWSASALTERLSRDDPAYTGRLVYWFDQEALTARWFREQFERSRVALGPRYVPESNVELPIRRDFLGFVRDASVLGEVEAWRVGLSERVHSAIAAVKRASNAEAEPHSGGVQTAVDALIDRLDQVPVGLHRMFPLSEWTDAANVAKRAIQSALSWSYELPEVRIPHSGSTLTQNVRPELYQLGSLVSDLLEAFNSQRWRLVNRSQLLLIGEAGSGKSHLLADIVERQLVAGAPALLILSSMLSDSEPWRQILTQLDLPPNRQVKHFLAALDSAAEAAGVRALICIDAINEHKGLDIWLYRLAAFLKEVEPFPRVVICI